MTGDKLGVFNWRKEDDWHLIVPGLHVGDIAFMQRQQRLALPPSEIASLATLLRTEGYFQLAPQPFGTPVTQLADAVRALVSRGLPPAFAFVYDEFWCAYYALHDVLRGVLGADYVLLPDFWAWHVDPQRGEAGWPPHRDKGHVALFPDGTPKSLTIWIPLSDATTLNGCMYLVPADRDPLYGTARDGEWRGNVAFPTIRALPAAAGSVLCWNQAVLHWGSQSNTRADAPRMSMAFEFQRADVAPFNQPLMPPLQVWDLGTRLQLIAKQILQYKHMYPLEPALEQAALEML